LLETAGKLSIPYIKPGYFRYKLANVLDEFHEASRQYRGLVELASKNGVQVGIHNHPNYVGASLWDTACMLENLDPRWCGYYFDLGQVSANMGEHEPQVAANLAIPRLKMAAVKDVTWVPGGTRKWRAVVCPLGQGMAPWKDFLHSLAQSDFHGPITMHLEFETPGVTDNQGVALSREKCPQVMVMAKQNLDTLKSLIHEAYGA
jgi:sugar phosphate isomerase/epimerase